MKPVTTIRANIYRQKDIGGPTVLVYAGDADIVISSIAAVITEDRVNYSGNLMTYLIREHEREDGTVRKESDTAHRIILNSGVELFTDELGIINIERYISSGNTLEEWEEANNE